MAGGVIEGFKKCFTGKNISVKHVFLYLIAVMTAFPTAMATISTESSSRAAAMTYYVRHPFMGLICLAGTIIIMLYIFHFLHNAIKLAVWRETQNDQLRIQSLQIMPEINNNIFSRLGSIIKFIVLWFLIILIFGFIASFLARIPLLNFLFIPVILIIIACYAFTFPYIQAKFAKDYKTKDSTSPFLVLSLLPKIFLPHLILLLKMLVFYICFYIFTQIIFIILLPIIILSGPLALLLLSILMGLISYLGIILALVYNYCVAHIYYERIVVESEC